MNDITLNPGTDDAPIILVDLNSMLNAALLGGKDSDAVITIVDGKPVSTNSARYGVDRMVARLTEVLGDLGATPRNVVGVWDGRGAKAVRQAILPQYKASLKAEPVHEQLNLARPMVSQLLHDVGAHTVDCESCEADDVIGYMTHRLRTRRTIVVTGDGDLSVLVDDNTSVLKLDNSGKGKGDKLNENPFGPFPHKYITVYKALVGDTSDKIPGAKGFGDAAFVKLVARWGVEGLAEMERLIKTGRLQELEEDVPDLPALRKVIDDADNVYASWKCASLMPQRVNALRFPLNWRPGFAKLWSELAPSDRVEAWKPWYATQTLVHAGNYERVLASLRPALYDTPFTALDIETSVPEESLAWMEQTRSRGAKGVDVDTLGSMLTGMSLTFGDNSQHTIYVTVDHREDDVVRNIKSEQARALVELTPQATHTVIHNRAFEFPVLRNEWGQAWESNGWHGFVPNALDTKIEASYVNENLPLGLKRLAFLYLNYKQDSYDETTTLQGAIGTLQRGGVRLRTFKHCVRPARMEMCLNDGGEQEEFEVEPAVYEEWEARQYQMNELSAAHVFGYGCDDTRVTAALHNWFRIVMELEGTWNTYLMVEQYPEYLTSLAYMTGIPVDLGLLSRMEAEDRATLAEAENKLDSFLVAAGWDGTVLPEISELTTATAKQAIEIVLGPVGVSEDGEPIPFSTRKRKLEAIAEDVEEAYPDSETALLLANALRENALPVVKALVEQHFTGRPNINFGSPKQMQRLLYDVIGITPRVFNKLTDKQREDEEFRSAFYSRRDFEEGKMDREPTEFERKVWMSKASTDDDAVEVALFRDELSDESRDVLKAYLNIKTMRTRISLFYNAYAVIPHWKDGLVHSQFNQCQAATRRWSSSEPNLQQLPSRGEGVKFRDLLPAPLNYVYVSLDWSGQELRLMADYSQDANMLACYIGDNLMDIHSLVAVRAAPFIWGSTTTYEEFQLLRSSDEADVAKKAKSLRDGAKVTNFATQYGAQAPKVAIQLKTDEDTAQQFIDAKDDTFPGINRWKAEVEQEAETTGISTTMLGTPRHLRDLVMSPNSWVRSKAARQASNFCIQGSGAEMAKLALSRLWLSGAFIGGYRAQFVGPIHDEVVFLVHRDDVLPVVRLAHAIMRAQYANMTVPLESSLAIGLTFKAEVELGESFTDEQVLQAVQALFVKDDEEVVA